MSDDGDVAGNVTNGRNIAGFGVISCNRVNPGRYRMSFVSGIEVLSEV